MGARKMRFARFGPQTERSVDRAVGQVASLRRVVRPQVKAAVRFGTETVCEEKTWIACDGLIKQTCRLKVVLAGDHGGHHK